MLIKYQEVCKILSDNGLSGKELINRVQRLGFDAQGNRLVVDGIEGPRTRGALFLNPETVVHPVAMVALDELLAGSQEIGGNNAGKFVAKYFRILGLKVSENKDLGNHCAAFASYCLQTAFPDEKTPKSGGARALGNRIGAAGQKVTNPRAPRQGDILIHSRVALDDWRGHASVVVGSDDKFVYTIDSNVGSFPAPCRVYRQPLSNPSRSATTQFLFYARYK
jgi:hypothetical protein